MKRQRIWPVLLAAAIGVYILCGLGVWQVKRLAWKEALIAEIDASLAEPAKTLIELNEVENAARVNKRVHLEGSFVGEPIRKIAILNGGPGWELINMFRIASTQFGAPYGNGQAILVSRGVVADGKDVFLIGNEIEIEGILKLHPNKPGYFDVPNNPAANQWYTWDVKQMSSKLADSSFSPYVLHLLPGSRGTEGLQVDPPKSSLHNHHLGYAITWFGLAAALVGVTGAFIWRSTRS
jgi:surfeit locus 1 family protein